MKKHTQKYLPLIIGSACALGVVIGSFFNFPKNERVYLSAHPNKQKLEQLIDYINRDYVDDVNTDSIVDVTINTILKDLDPHSTYIPRDKFMEVSENLEGDFVGIGIQFFMVEDTVAVIRTIENGPSEKVGILAGDRLVYADGRQLAAKGLSSDSLREILRGEVESRVNLKIARRGEKELLNFPVVRKHIPITSVDATFMLSDKLGYVKLNRFSKNTGTEFKQALKKLENRGAEEIVLDLRGNGGGYLKEAIKVADEFLEKDKLILKTKDKRGKVEKTFATSAGDYKHARVYVLIDQNSASASEVVAGALQDNDIGTIVGQRSFGKGLVQREMKLGDGSAVRLTVARYYTPTGRSIQRPYKNGDSQSYFHDYIDRYNSGELVNRDSIHVDDSLKFTTPKGKIVYGGGGIIPDVFVPRDINYKKESLDYMLKGGIMDRFVFNQLDKNRPYYNSLTKEDLVKNLEIPDEMISEFREYLQGFRIRFNPDRYQGLLKDYLKASMAQQLFGTNAFEQFLMDRDAVIQKVLEIDKEADLAL